MVCGCGKPARIGPVHFETHLTLIRKSWEKIQSALGDDPKKTRIRVKLLNMIIKYRYQRLNMLPSQVKTLP